ncbi:hypothetical protein Lal_00026986 [Lupinus albus]|nr:hypothetical protein Lal_00026986 [Lupinus albus]
MADWQMENGIVKRCLEEEEEEEEDRRLRLEFKKKNFGSSIRSKTSARVYEAILRLDNTPARVYEAILRLEYMKQNSGSSIRSKTPARVNKIVEDAWFEGLNMKGKWDC